MYLNFFQISKIPFKQVLDYLGVDYEETATELKGKTFIVNKKKNLFFEPHGEAKGSVINFVSNLKQIPLREAAAILQNQFIIVANSPGIPEYDLHYCEFLEKEGISIETSKLWEVGMVKNHRGPAAGKIAFKIRNMAGEKVGYALLDPKDRSWFYFKGYEHIHIYNFHRVKDTSGVLLENPLEAVRFNTSNAVALTHTGITDMQMLILQHFEHIETFSEKIAIKLMRQCFVKILR